MPVIRGSLRPSSDGSVKSFIIILTVIGFLCFIYYKMKISPPCGNYMEELSANHLEMNRLLLVIKTLKDQILTQKSEFDELTLKQNGRNVELDAAKVSDSDNAKLVDKLKDELKLALENLENCGSLSNLGTSCANVEDRFKQEIKDLKAVISHLKNLNKFGDAKYEPVVNANKVKNFSKNAVIDQGSNQFMRQEKQIIKKTSKNEGRISMNDVNYSDFATNNSLSRGDTIKDKFFKKDIISLRPEVDEETFKANKIKTADETKMQVENPKDELKNLEKEEKPSLKMKLKKAVKYDPDDGDYKTLRKDSKQDKVKKEFNGNSVKMEFTEKPQIFKEQNDFKKDQIDLRRDKMELNNLKVDNEPGPFQGQEDPWKQPV